MQNETKLLCNACYQPMDIVKYPDGVYINPCPCTDEALYNEGKKEGFEEGKEEGEEYGQEYGWERGFEEAQSESRVQIEELEEKLEQYSHLIEEDEYLDRTGMT